ncbi:CidA/LrgA family protein [Xanthobacter sp. KR7-65]|uniref:CidA/LrgA family protein n=1 Tax=Xanthobacter sp. KR7-65 TaxID=3156612 RepID=UPI0032B592FE
MLRTMRAALQRSMLMQIALLAVFWGVGEAVVRVTGLPVPGGIVGMGVVLALLSTGWVRPASVRRGASWLLAEMLLFFVPAVMAVLDHKELIGFDGLKIGAVILLGTLVVMAGTALAVDLCLRLWARPALPGGGHADA